VRLSLAVLLLASSALAQAPAPSDAPPPSDATQAEMAVVQDLLTRAITEFEGVQQSRSIVLLDDVVARLENLRRQGTVTPRGREMLVQAYDMRARAYYNIGLQEKAGESFRLLLQVSPQHALSKEKVSPKIVEYFNTIKKSLVGFLAVSSKPAGARVTLNGEFLSLTDFFPLEVLAGDYTVEVSRDGYRTETRGVSIAPRATETLQVEMQRTAASALVVSEPVGVEVWVDGQLVTTTAGTLSPDLHEVWRQRGVDPMRASALTEVANLSLGSHVIEFRKKCFEPIRRTIEVPEAKDYEAEPVRLEDSLASLRLESDPPGAVIKIDDQPMGVTPREIEGICSGRHRIEVKHAAGKFVQELVLEKGEALTLQTPIRPTLAFLGVVAEGAAGERRAAEIEQELSDRLAKITGLNVLPVSKALVDNALDSERVTRLALAHGTAEADAVRRVTEKLAASLEAQGFLVAVIPDERLVRNVVLHLLAAGNTVSDRWEVSWSDPVSYQRFLAAVDRKATLQRPWAGLITVDTLLHEGPVVLRTTAVSPAAASGIAPGEVVTAVDGRPVKRTAELLAAVAERKEKDRLKLQVKGAAGPREVELVVGRTPQEIPLHDPTLLYNKVMMDLRQQVEGWPGTEAAAFARLNLALCAMHFGDYAAAHEHLLKARAELPQRPGISQGTAGYYLGVALERLGYDREAQEAYRTAASNAQATLFSNDGPTVSEMVGGAK
jgi:tetratricopeptide (TPR) repeat protein